MIRSYDIPSREGKPPGIDFAIPPRHRQDTRVKICPLCQREIPEDLESRHHLIPKLKGGTHGPIAILHSTCHSKIHAVFTEAELARDYDTIEKLLANDEMQKFVAWVQKRPIDFRDGTASRRRQRHH